MADAESPQVPFNALITHFPTMSDLEINAFEERAQALLSGTLPVTPVPPDNQGEAVLDEGPAQPNGVGRADDGANDLSDRPVAASACAAAHFDSSGEAPDKAGKTSLRLWDHVTAGTDAQAICVDVRQHRPGMRA